ncbi:MAG: right-handed parallel beta-helix repeat-containing protein [Saccharofermentanales bacterium]
MKNHFIKVILFFCIILIACPGFIYAATAPVINVKSGFHAKGDGIANDSAAIQSAFSAAAQMKNPVYFPAGTYLIDQAVIPSGVRVYGDGPANSIIKRLANSTNVQYSILCAKSARDITVEDICIDGNRSDVTTIAHNLIFTGCSDIKVDNCRFTNSKGVGIYSDNGDSDLANDSSSVTNCQMDNNAHDGMLVSNVNNLEISGCNMHDNGAGGFETNTGMSRNIRFINNTVTKNSGSGVGFSGHRNLDPMQSNTENCLISGNTISKNGMYGLAVASGKSTISDNVITENGAHDPMFGGMLANGNNMTITGNRIQNNKAVYGVDAGNSVKSVFSGNIIENNGCYAGGIGINFGTSESITFKGNTLSYNGNASGGTQIYVHGYDGGGDDQGQTVDFPGLTYDITVSDNTVNVRSNQLAIWVDQYTTNINVTGNKVNGASSDSKAILFTCLSGTAKDNVASVLDNPSISIQNTIVIPDSGDEISLNDKQFPGYINNLLEIRTYSSNQFFGKVCFIPVLNAGSGYASAPDIAISGGGGTGASAEAHMYKGKINYILLKDNGSGYTSAPKITISGGGGSGASAKAIVGCNNFDGRRLTVYCDSNVAMQDYGNLSLTGGEFAGGKGSKIVFEGAGGKWKEISRYATPVSGISKAAGSYSSSAAGNQSSSGSAAIASSRADSLTDTDLPASGDQSQSDTSTDGISGNGSAVIGGQSGSSGGGTGLSGTKSEGAGADDGNPSDIGNIILTISIILLIVIIGGTGWYFIVIRNKIK